MAKITIPASVTAISPTAFANINPKNFIIDAPIGSVADQYAIEYGFERSHKDSSPSQENEGFVYEINDEGNAIITEYIGKNNKVQIPAVLPTGSGHSVTRIEGGTFSNNNIIEEITLESNVKEIGSYAFSGCTKLTTIKLHESPQLEEIGAYDFTECTNLTTIGLQSNIVELPISLKLVGAGSFSNTGVRTVKINASPYLFGEMRFLIVKN